MGTDNDKSPPRIAVIDDEAIVCREIKRGLEKDHYVVETFIQGESALNRLSQIPFDLVLCDLMLRDHSGLEVLKKIKARCPQTEVIIITGYSSIDTAIEAIQAGAFHYVTKPVKIAELKALAARAIEKVYLVKEKETLKKALDSRSRYPEIIGQSQLVQEVFRLIDKVSMSYYRMLVYIETNIVEAIGLNQYNCLIFK